ncbi:hypothetical protein [Actinoplanes sp. TFC3]|uniref:hypothetical protein n=1 Tax=Actinoplanes sp. TFC3 TaxID=1710355 RepID=UPI00128FF89D|nr:hypothetical protein [Actinoplanes sp. TFC3]
MTSPADPPAQPSPAEPALPSAGPGQAGPQPGPWHLPPEPKRKWRPWLVATVAAWGVLLAGGAIWAVRNDPPTVAEQRTIADALPLVGLVTGVVVQAADAPDRTVEIGALTVDRGCSITPVRPGVEALRDVTVRVRDDQVPGALDSVAAGLPADYRAEVRHNEASTRFALHADAGNFVGVDASAAGSATAFTVQVSTGCRPRDASIDASPAAGTGTAPPAFLDVLKALDVQPKYTVNEAACPNGKTARTFLVEGAKVSQDLGWELGGVTGGAVVIRADAHEWGYRVGEVSLVVTENDGSARISGTVGCR